MGAKTYDTVDDSPVCVMAPAAADFQDRDPVEEGVNQVWEEGCLEDWLVWWVKRGGYGSGILVGHHG